MIPEKIYLPKEEIEERKPWIETSYDPNWDECYIRKDALLEWLEQNRNQAQMWFDKYATHDDLAAKQVWEEVIDKLNEM